VAGWDGPLTHRGAERGARHVSSEITKALV
jgi:hypothetical protein